MMHVIMLSFIIMIVIMMNVIMMSVIIMGDVRLNFIVPNQLPTNSKFFYSTFPWNAFNIEVIRQESIAFRPLKANYYKTSSMM
jgi:hypothetical protein